MMLTLSFDSIDEMAQWLRCVRVITPNESTPPAGAPVDDLELTVRTLNCLRAENIATVEQLCGYTESQLLCLPSFGRKGLNEIKEVLGSRGLALR